MSHHPNLPPIGPNEYDVILPFAGDWGFAYHPKKRSFHGYDKKSQSAAFPLQVFRNVGDVFLYIDGESTQDKTPKEFEKLFIDRFDPDQERGYALFRMLDINYHIMVDAAPDDSAPTAVAAAGVATMNPLPLTATAAAGTLLTPSRAKVVSTLDDTKRQLQEQIQYHQANIDAASRVATHRIQLEHCKAQLNALLQQEIALYEQKIRELKTVDLIDDDEDEDDVKKAGLKRKYTRGWQKTPTGWQKTRTTTTAPAAKKPRRQTRQTAADPPSDGSFLPSSTWQGPRENYYFGNGPHGMGYYLDTTAPQQQEEETPSTPSRRRTLRPRVDPNGLN